MSHTTSSHNLKSWARAHQELRSRFYKAVTERLHQIPAAERPNYVAWSRGLTDVFTLFVIYDSKHSDGSAYMRSVGDRAGEWRDGMPVRGVKRPFNALFHELKSLTDNMPEACKDFSAFVWDAKTDRVEPWPEDI